MRVKQNRSEVLTHIFYVDETPTDSGTVTVTITNLDEDVVSTGNATYNSGTKTYSYVLPAQSELGPLRVAWNGSLDDVTSVDVVGNHYFELIDLRVILPKRGLQKGLDPAIYSLEDLKRVRDLASVSIEEITQTSFVTVTKQERVISAGSVALVDRRMVTEVVSVDGEAYTGEWTRAGVIPGLADGAHDVVYTTSWSPDGVTPADISQAALELAVAFLDYGNSNIPDNVETFTSDEGTYRYVVPGRGTNFTGIPRVDAVLNRYRFQDVGVS